MLLTVFARPKAKVSKIKEWLDKDTVKIDIAATPEKGKANRVLLKIVAKHFKISPSEIEIVRGKTTRIKQLKLPKSS